MTQQLIDRFSNTDFQDSLNGVTEELFLLADGTYVLIGTGGANTIYSYNDGAGGRVGGTRSHTLSKAEAEDYHVDHNMKNLLMRR